MRRRKHVLCDSGNLDILQSQMNMSANTVGQILGYLKRRIRKQVGVTSQAAGTVYAQLRGQGSPLLWLLSSFSSFHLSVGHHDSQSETRWGWASGGDTYWFTLVRHYITAALSISQPHCRTRSLCVICLTHELPGTAWALISSRTQSYSLLMNPNCSSLLTWRSTCGADLNKHLTYSILIYIL